MTAGDPLLLAIDQGTSSTKCLLVGPDGAIVARASAPLAVSYPRPGWVEQSAEEVWAGVVAAVAECLRGVDPHRVAGIGVSAQRESALVWERDGGRPVGPLLGWQDQRTADAARDLRVRGLEPLVRQISGLPLDPMFTALKAAWLLDQVDPDRSRSRRGELCLGTVDSWLTWRLTGRHAIEIGNASRTQLFDVSRRAWSPELLELFTIPEQVLPAVLPSTEQSVGGLGTCEGLKKLLPGVALRAVLGDSHAALFAHGAFAPGQLKATFGTGSSVMGLIADPATLDPGLCQTIAWQVEDKTAPYDGTAYAAEGNIRAAGAVLVWLATLLDTTPEEVLRLAASSDSGGTVLVPAFGGLAAPWWDDAALAGWTGLTLGTRREHLARAAVESIAFQVADVVEATARGAGPVDCLLADGGGSASELLMRLVAEATGLPVLRARAQNLSALGAAHLAGVGAGLWDLTTLAHLPRDRDRFTPEDEEASGVLDVAAWRSAVAHARFRPPNGVVGESSSIAEER